MSQPKIPVEQVTSGTGSGLDADTLDGQSSSAFATSGHTHTGYASSTHTHPASMTLSNIATTGTGVVGSYALLVRPAGAINPGDVFAGADLRYSSSGGHVGAAPAGSWRAMGYSIGSSWSTVFVRIS